MKAQFTPARIEGSCDPASCAIATYRGHAIDVYPITSGLWIWSTSFKFASGLALNGSCYTQEEAQSEATRRLDLALDQA